MANEFTMSDLQRVNARRAKVAAKLASAEEDLTAFAEQFRLAAAKVNSLRGEADTLDKIKAAILEAVPEDANDQMHDDGDQKVPVEHPDNGKRRVENEVGDNHPRADKRRRIANEDEPRARQLDLSAMLLRARKAIGGSSIVCRPAVGVIAGSEAARMPLEKIQGKVSSTPAACPQRSGRTIGGPLMGGRQLGLQGATVAPLPALMVPVVQQAPASRQPMPSPQYLPSAAIAVSPQPAEALSAPASPPERWHGPEYSPRSPTPRRPTSPRSPSYTPFPPRCPFRILPRRKSPINSANSEPPKSPSPPVIIKQEEMSPTPPPSPYRYIYESSEEEDSAHQREEQAQLLAEQEGSQIQMRATAPAGEAESQSSWWNRVRGVRMFGTWFH